MLTIYGRKEKFCDGVSRRSFLKIGGLAMGSLCGLSLADILRCEAASGPRSQHKALINIQQFPDGQKSRQNGGHS